MFIGGVQARTITTRLTPMVNTKRLEFLSRENLLEMAMLQKPWTAQGIERPDRPARGTSRAGVEQFVPGFAANFTEGTPYLA